MNPIVYDDKLCRFKNRYSQFHVNVPTILPCPFPIRKAGVEKNGVCMCVCVGGSRGGKELGGGRRYRSRGVKEGKEEQ